MDNKTRQDIDNLTRKAYTKDLALYLAYYCKENNQNAAGKRNRNSTQKQDYKGGKE